MLDGEDGAILLSPDLPGILRTLLCVSSCTAGSMCWALQSSVILADWLDFPEDLLREKGNGDF